MDTLVARYSRPAYQQNELFSEQEQQDLMDGAPALSLKFAMPPVAHVSFCLGCPQEYGIKVRLTSLFPPAFCLAPRRDRRPLQSNLPHQDCARHNDTCVPVPGRYYRCDGLASHSGKLDRQSDGEEGD